MGLLGQKSPPWVAAPSPLLTGEDPGPAGGTGAAWTFQRSDGGRSFYTSLGFKTDFESSFLLCACCTMEFHGPPAYPFPKK